MIRFFERRLLEIKKAGAQPGSSVPRMEHKQHQNYKGNEMPKSIKNANIVVKMSRMTWIQRLIFAALCACVSAAVAIGYASNIKTPVPDSTSNNAVSQIANLMNLGM